jgi:hypothetical protein
MAYTYDIALALTTGLTLSAQLVNTAGVNVGSAVTTGFSEVAATGNYLWHYAAFPDNFRGGVVFSAGGVFKAFVAVNPEEAVLTATSSAGASYATYTEVKASMPDVIDATTSTHDTLLTTLALRASRMIDAVFGQEEGAFAEPAAASDRHYNGNGGRWCYIDPCTTISAIAVKGSETSSSYDAWTVDTDYDKAAGGQDEPEWSAGYYTLLLVSPGMSKVFSKGRKTVKVTAKWGRTATVPDLIKQATIIQTGRWFKRGQQAFQDVAGQAGMGELTYAQKLDPDIAEMLRTSPYRRGAL